MWLVSAGRSRHNTQQMFFFCLFCSRPLSGRSYISYVWGHWPIWRVGSEKIVAIFSISETIQQVLCGCKCWGLMQPNRCVTLELKCWTRINNQMHFAYLCENVSVIMAMFQHRSNTPTLWPCQRDFVDPQGHWTCRCEDNCAPLSRVTSQTI